MEEIIYHFIPSLLLGFIIGWAARKVVTSADERTRGVSPTGGQSLNSAVERAEQLKETVDRAVETNREAAEIITQMQNLLSSVKQCNSNSTRNEVSE